MAPMSEADTIILNKANIALAKSQRLIASWLPRGSAKEPPANAKSEAEIDREEQELFTPMPELYATHFITGRPLPAQKGADG